MFAVPGSIDSAASRGTHKLIKQGVKLIENIYDIQDEILPQVEMRSKDATREERRLKQDDAEEKKLKQKTAAYGLTNGTPHIEKHILKSLRY